MSGGSYDYAYSRVMDMADSLRKEGCCDCAEPALRELFREHLRKRRGELLRFGTPATCGPIDVDADGRPVDA